MITKKIGIDLIPTQPIDVHKYHGGGEYAKRLFLEISNKANDENIACIYDPNKPIIEEIELICKKMNFEMIPMHKEDDLEQLLSKHHVNRFYSALPNTTKWNLSNVEFLFTIHGLRSIEMPTDKYEYKYFIKVKDYFKYLVKQLFKSRYIRWQKNKIGKFLYNQSSSTIIVPSYHTKYSIKGNFPTIQEENIKVLYSPRIDITPNTSSNIIEEFGVEEKKFILLILGSRWIKNNYRTILAIDEMYNQIPEIKIKTLIIGVNLSKNPYHGLKNKDRFIFKGYVDSDILERLYKDAFVFVYPTLNEGFGYPPLEAMKYGTPVITSAISSVPEVCGDAALFFNPYDISEIRNRILQVIFQESIRDRMIERGLVRFQEIKEMQQTMLDELVNIILGD